ncbi:MAG: hypothetical protein H0Z33_14715 [Bacillaceae bacterium]|nr:hypothetical protein [Bacillaceae bacterium]
MKRRVLLLTMFVLIFGITTVYAATSPYGTLFGFNLAKININNQEAPLRAIDVNGQIYVPIQLYVQEMNGTYTYDFNNYVVNITRGTGQPAGYQPGTGTANPQDPYGYNTPGQSGNLGNPYNPYGYGTPTGSGQPTNQTSGYQNYQSSFYDPRYDFEILYDIIPYRDPGERYHIGFIEEDLESLEAYMEEIERMHEEMQAVFESTLDKYNQEMTLEEAERRYQIRMNTFKVLEERFDDLVDEVEDMEKRHQDYEDHLEDALKELEDAMDDQEDALKELRRYLDYKKTRDLEDFKDKQDDTINNLNQAENYLDQAMDGIEDALDRIND